MVLRKCPPVQSRFGFLLERIFTSFTISSDSLCAFLTISISIEKAIKQISANEMIQLRGNRFSCLFVFSV